MKDWGKRFDDKWNTLDKNGGFIHMITLNTHNPEAIKHFLATALEEQKMKVEVETGLKNFQVTMEEIAKARKDERQKVLAEVEGLLVDEKSKKYTEKQWCKCGSLPNDDGYCEDCRRKVVYKDIYMEDEADLARNKLRAELRAKLVEMKEEK